MLIAQLMVVDICVVQVSVNYPLQANNVAQIMTAVAILMVIYVSHLEETNFAGALLILIVLLMDKFVLRNKHVQAVKPKVTVQHSIVLLMYVVQEPANSIHAAKILIVPLVMIAY